MNVRNPWLTTFALALAFWPVTPANAQVILQPASASSTMGTGVGSPNFTVNQSGLNVGYTSLFTNFNSYFASNPTHNSANAANTWQSAPGNPVGNFDFDLGGSFTIGSFALWNAGANFTNNVNGFTLLADSSPSFSSPVVLGSFNASPNLGSLTAVLPDVFNFAATQASFVRMQITSNFGGTDTRFGEAAFQVVPEPSALVLCGLAGVVSAWRLRRSRRNAADAANPIIA